jgi:methionyl-tRNA synthetase
VLGFLKNNTLEDLCITRPKARLEWGIPLPFDEEYVTYVWFDALSNYASIPAALGDDAAAGPVGLETKPDAPSLWPADIHVIGKDILKFHAVYWPIMLKAMGLPLPGQVLVHGWWQKDGQKMSKTTGNVVDPIAVIDEWGVDAFRYYVVRELDIGPDGNWTDESFQARYSAELANGLGNLVNRSLSMLNRYRGGTLEATSDELAADAEKWIAEARKNYESHHLQAALVSIWGLVDRANQYVEQTAPFKLAKLDDQADRLNEVLYNLAEACRILAVLLWPVVPETAGKIFGQLGIDDSPANFSLAKWGGLAKGHTCNKPTPLFPRKDLEKK